jgi:uncharacterized protein involved in type VI secretion and phage assembly
VSSMVELIRSVVRRELAAVRGPALGAVTAVHPHADDGDDLNDEVDVTLQHEGVELARVPVAVPFPGVAAPVKVGDLVLVQFLGGDLQQPLVTACFHTDEDRPPKHPDGTHVVEQRIDGKPRNRFGWAADGQVTVDRLDDSGTAVVTVLLDKDGNLKLTAKDKTMTITCTTLTVVGDVQLDDGNLTVAKGNVEVSDGTVKATHGSGSTTIDGHKITGT